MFYYTLGLHVLVTTAPLFLVLMSVVEHFNGLANNYKRYNYFKRFPNIYTYTHIYIIDIITEYMMRRDKRNQKSLQSNKCKVQ